MMRFFLVLLDFKKRNSSTALGKYFLGQIGLAKKKEDTYFGWLWRLYETFLFSKGPVQNGTTTGVQMTILEFVPLALVGNKRLRL